MISTPLGEIHFFIDDREVAVAPESLGADDMLCPHIDGRFKVGFDFRPDGLAHKLTCRLFPCTSVKGYPESGERLECYGFYNADESVKVSIGIEADTTYFNDERGELVRDENCEYDYDGEYESGEQFSVSYALLPQTQTSRYIFGVAWILNCTPENETETWYGADPTYMGK